MDHFNLLNKVTEEGAPPCYVAVDENRQLVYAANYHQGIVHVYRILEDGSLEDADKVIIQSQLVLMKTKTMPMFITQI